MSRAPKKPIDARGLRRAAERYLTRYFAPRTHVRRVLMRKVHASIEAHGGERESLVAAVDALLDELERAGALNDRAYAEGKARALLRKGRPPRDIRNALRVRGVPASMADEVIAELTEEVGDPTRVAAARYVRARRLGPYRDGEARRAWREKDLARLGRRGFPWSVAAEVLDLPDPDAVEALLFP